MVMEGILVIYADSNVWADAGVSEEANRENKDDGDDGLRVDGDSGGIDSERFRFTGEAAGNWEIVDRASCRSRNRSRSLIEN